MRTIKARLMPGLVTAVIASWLLVPATVHSETFYNVGWTGVAIKGYDPVAYFTAKMPVKGDSDFEYEWSGARWRFANAMNLEMFKGDPEKYAPQYGGFCAYGVSVGKKFDGDPRFWRVEDGRLYLNLNAKIQETWLKDVDGHIEQADEQWGRIATIRVADL